MGAVPQAYIETIAELSQRLIEAQRPLRILDAIKWDPGVEEFLKRTSFREMPALGPERYAAHSPLTFDPENKRSEFCELRESIRRRLGPADRVGTLLCEIVEEYLLVIELLESRGTRRFWERSRALYGSPKDKFISDHNTVLSLGVLLSEIFGALPEARSPDLLETLSAEDVVSQLSERLDLYFGSGVVEAKLSDGIVADSAAGGESIKVKQGARFSQREVDLLEVHEGWVHVGTTLNGKAQNTARWLAKGSPRVASTQEGLAVILEIFTFRSFPKRARNINDRVLAIAMAEDGANLLEVIAHFRGLGYSDDEAFFAAQRVFRGGVAEGGAPFTKDIAYCKGFIENYNFMRAAVRAGRPETLPYLFAGKLHVNDVPLIYELAQDGIVAAPQFLPPQFRDLQGVTVWMAFSNFLNRLDLKRVQEHYDQLFHSADSDSHR